ncbi:capsular biosynthesis protein [Burkholderia metallica]|uniref:Capsular biosynthesis protein n=1 Tax=Burkholderia metallica TaxID=488729 RepID=A0ABT8P7V1_9BURK|nr:capsular biosynthesis protein [Burkholderia metallica]MDN7930902.1 capsular biosynthesis protein [Burkholderia metallica]
MRRIIMDLDDTICSTRDGNYLESTPQQEVISRLHEYRAKGFQIVISTSRNMRTYEGNIGKITANTLPVIINWLDRHNVPYDEIYVGKPWCGTEGFYVDDKAIRPDEFIGKSYDEIKTIVGIK